MRDGTDSTVPRSEELLALRRRVVELEAVAAEYQQGHERLAEREASLCRILEDAEAG